MSADSSEFRVTAPRGSVRPYRETRGASSDGDNLLPPKYRANHIAVLVERAKSVGLFVMQLGGERYSVSDARGRFKLREGNFTQAMDCIEGSTQ